MGMPAKMKRFLMILLIAWCAFPLCSNAQGEASVGNCTYILHIKDSEIFDEKIIADVQIIIDIFNGEGYAFIPLPFSERLDTDLIIDPNSAYNPLLNGFFRPENNSGVGQVKLSKNSAHISFTYHNVTISSQKISRNTQDINISFLLNRAYKKISEKYPDAIFPHFNEVRVRGIKIVRSNPNYIWSEVNNEYVIELDNNITDITFIYERQQRQYILYIILGIFGALLGYFATPRIVHNIKKSKISLGISLAGLIALIYIFFNILDPDQRWKDTTTIVTSGMVFGLLIGFIIGSISQIYSKENDENPSG